MADFLEINGEAVPTPGTGLRIIISTAVNSGRNASNTVVGETVGRPALKYDNLHWAFLTAAEWKKILSLFSNFFVVAKVYNPETGKFVRIKMYPGDRSGEVYYIDPVTKEPTHFKDCKVNIIDCAVLTGDGANVFKE